MLRRPIQLTIPQPCQQRWQDMAIEAAGRFCSNCQKTVVDFAAMSDEQIVAYLSGQTKAICGRFTTNQLNRSLLIAPNASAYSLKQRWLEYVVVGLMSWSTAQGQSGQPPHQSVLVRNTVAPESQNAGDGITRHQSSPIATDSTWVIEGRVIDGTDKVPLRGVTITVKGTNRITTTDTTGLFRLTLPNDWRDRVFLRVSSVGFIYQEIEINAMHQRDILISLAEDVTLLGEVIYVGEVVTKQKPTFLEHLRNRIQPHH